MISIIIANSVGEINEQTKVILVVSATLVSPKKKKNLKHIFQERKRALNMLKQFWL